MSLIRRDFSRAYFESPFYRSHPLSRRNVTRFNFVLAHKPEGRLLEVGSGNGDFLALAASRFDVSSIDISPYAGSGLPPALRDRIMIGDIERIPLPGRSFDVVTAFNVLEHLRRPTETIRKITNALAPDGIFVGSVPCNAGLIGSIHTAATKCLDRTHCSCYKVSVWRKVFQEATLLDTRFFGEFMLDGHVCVYLFTPLWPHLSFNMMFLSHKLAISTPT